jgi:hypothetical protein
VAITVPRPNPRAAGFAVRAVGLLSLAALVIAVQASGIFDDSQPAPASSAVDARRFSPRGPAVVREVLVVVPDSALAEELAAQFAMDDFLSAEESALVTYTSASWAADEGHVNELNLIRASMGEVPLEVLRVVRLND